MTVGVRPRRPSLEWRSWRLYLRRSISVAGASARKTSCPVLAGPGAGIAPNLPDISSRCPDRGGDGVRECFCQQVSKASPYRRPSRPGGATAVGRMPGESSPVAVGPLGSRSRRTWRRRRPVVRAWATASAVDQSVTKQKIANKSYRTAALSCNLWSDLPHRQPAGAPPERDTAVPAVKSLNTVTLRPPLCARVRRGFLNFAATRRKHDFKIFDF